MATQAHCAYCFETLAANFERRQPLAFSQVEELWEQYRASSKDPVNGAADDEDESDGADEDEDAEMTDVEPSTARPAAISRLLNSESAASSSSSLQSGTSSSRQSSKQASGATTPASSMSSRSSLPMVSRRRRESEEEYPLFVTWNTISRSGYKSLRGCIGTFEPQELEYGLRSYALTRSARHLIVLA